MLLAFHLTRVRASIQGYAQPVGLCPGGFNAPCTDITNSAADGLAVQLGLKHKRLCAGVCDPNPQTGRFGVPKERLGFFVSATGQPVNQAGGQLFGLAQVNVRVFSWSCHVGQNPV
jgi:hypothetical protein